MKQVIYVLIGCIFLFQSCASQKKLETTTSFALGSASCQEWVGGKEASGKGLLVKIAVDEMSNEEVTFQDMYFRGEMAKVILEKEENGMQATAKFFENKPDIIMHADATREVGNQPPKLKTKNNKTIPFELESTEAVLSYMEDNKVKYVKIVGVIDKPSRIYPSRPQN